ncbi:DNA mismatch repair endonuclease MutL [Cytobacillus gottheilii]|uniref:DNA mismatch repair protein MutL n=1 Tax=Cytobacillus gottheilii TaxID=859144 RepID=A0ABX8FH81_9BACI|nr:DNA mismatch repair endonuclease MutL [Cytobacillus gottheilii]QVY63376.1 DNA mismatch repair endonuclease MutL [Cytobacillus gottheilii]
MGKIIQLNDSLSNKIAAGEVVERPASVVKELLENAIDAGSTIIEIELEEAGLAKIRLIDNGEGIAEEDVLNAFHRHATSKIKDENDLFRIKTLGFRGEALPSIASVSNVELKTSTGDAGTRLVLSGGKVEVMEKASARKGTDISVTDLFFNTPARLKYVKTIHTELGNITDVVNRIALSHPEVSIKLIHNERKLLHTNGKDDVRQVLAGIYGLNIVKKMVPVTAQSLDFTISGYAALPEVTRASRNYISTMINGRFIKNYSLAKAIQEGYHTLLPIGRYPIVLLNIVMDPQLVDVNVHPSKMEVRLSKENELTELVKTSLQNVFKKQELIPAGYSRPIAVPKPKDEQTFLELDHLPEKASASLVKEKEPESIVSHSEYENVPAMLEQRLPAEDRPIEREAEALEEFIPAEVPELAWVSTDVVQQTDESFSTESAAPLVPPLYPIGQMHGTYIFAQNEKGLYIIDQHAAQERIKYEFFKEKVGQVAKELQELLIPITLEYSTDEMLKINEYQHELEKVGVFLETFGPTSYIVRAHPQWFPPGDEQDIIEDMIEQLLSMKKVDVKKLREEAAIMMSCKGSIKANHHLRNDEIQALLDELRQTNDPFTCPHGRPIIINYSVYELEKMFKRVM